MWWRPEVAGQTPQKLLPLVVTGEVYNVMAVTAGPARDVVVET